MQLIVSKQLVAATMSLVGEYQLALQGRDTARVLHSGEIEQIDRANLNVVLLQGGDEYSIVVDDEVVHRALDFYFGCVRLIAPFMKLLNGFSELCERIGSDLQRLLKE